MTCTDEAYADPDKKGLFSARKNAEALLTWEKKHAIIEKTGRNLPVFTFRQFHLRERGTSYEILSELWDAAGG